MTASRRHFIGSGVAVLGGAFLAANWTQVCEAADHAHQAAASPDGRFRFLTESEKRESAAIAACIIPSGATPGAREANAVYFIDAALASFMAGLAPDWRRGLAEFTAGFAAATPGAGSFSQATEAQQIAFLRTVDGTRFFNTMRTLTVLGTLTSPKYGGNHDKVGWRLMGFEDLHVFTPPFGDYDRDYAGFVPSTGSAS